MSDMKTILIVNPGSTSLKFRLFVFPEKHVLATGKVERIGEAESDYHFTILEKVHKGRTAVPDYRAAVNLVLEFIVGQESALPDLADLSAVGFKAVHAGREGLGPGAVFLTDRVMEEMKRFETVSPLHNRLYREVIECFQKLAPDVPRAALFETAFHSTISGEKTTCGIPHEWMEKHGIQRYGFHGASHRYIAMRAGEALGWSGARMNSARLISCHLGGSSSLCAIHGGKSVDTTMEFSPQSGIIHSTRCETIDPFIILFAQQELGLKPEEISRILCEESGLKGVSGISGDIRDLREWSALGSPRAILALRMFHHQVRRQVAAMAASLEGLDALIFTGGIGENSDIERMAICEGLAWLGVQLDEERNRRTVKIEGEISLAGSPVTVWVIPTNEELVVASEVYLLLSS